jgi:uncharacterized metal-binding protein YceD (DUF177 family)
MIQTAPEFSRPFDLEGLGQAGQKVVLEARPEERAALARRFGLLALDALGATLELTQRGGGIVEVAGSLKASVEQRSVVSLEPFRSEVEAEFQQRYVLGDEAAEAEEEFESGSGDAPELLGDAVIDLGEIVAEELALSLDPYPRRPGENLERSFFGPPGAEPEDEERENPFAALARLKKSAED